MRKQERTSAFMKMIPRKMPMRIPRKFDMVRKIRYRKEK
jgi:hypothetical protein